MPQINHLLTNPEFAALIRRNIQVDKGVLFDTMPADSPSWFREAFVYGTAMRGVSVFNWRKAQSRWAKWSRWLTGRKRRR